MSTAAAADKELRILLYRRPASSGSPYAWSLFLGQSLEHAGQIHTLTVNTLTGSSAVGCDVAIPSEDPSFTASIPLALVTEQEGIQLSKAFEGSVSALRPSSSRTWVEGVVQALRDTGVVEQTKTKAWLDFQSKNFIPGQMTEVKSRRPLCPEDPFEDSCED